MCFRCGRMVHDKKVCYLPTSMRQTNNTSERRGLWLKADYDNKNVKKTSKDGFGVARVDLKSQ